MSYYDNKPKLNEIGLMQNFEFWWGLFLKAKIQGFSRYRHSKIGGHVIDFMLDHDRNNVIRLNIRIDENIDFYIERRKATWTSGPDTDIGQLKIDGYLQPVIYYKEDSKSSMITKIVGNKLDYDQTEDVLFEIGLLI